MAPIIGIDLGTTNSLCAVFRDGSPELIPNALGKYLTPSVVGLLEDGCMIVGQPARELSITRPERAVAWFKRWMGTDRSAELGSRIYSSQELSSILLRSLKEDAQAYLGADITEAVITVPAYFNELQREATKLAGELADLKVRRIVNEPTAAALTYGLMDRHAEKKILVFDLGGGTFDVTLMDVFEGTLEIVSTAGENHLGGEDFTDRIVEWVLRQHGGTLEIAELREPLRVARLRQQCERAKRELGRQDECSIRVPRPDGTLDDECETLSMRLSDFASFSETLLERLESPVVRALRDGHAGKDDIDEVILVGGATRMPLVREFVDRFFAKEPLCSQDPDEVVALGAAVQAALIVDDASVDDMLMTDICPFTLGIEISKTFGNQLRDGYFLPIINRNTTIPVSREETVYTVVSAQTELVLNVFQGEGRKVADNVLLGTMEVAGIKPGPAGKAVTTRFTYDINGILEVEAIVDETGRRFSAVFTHNVKSLSKKEIKKAIENLKHIKFYPREDLDNQQLLLFAERVMGQVSPYQRPPLEEALDFYERTFHGNERESFEVARGNLLQHLSMLGHPYGS